MARGVPGTLRTLARAGIGYAWEAERTFPKALEAFQAGPAGLRPGEFYYDELLVDVARIQELSGNQAAAIETYRGGPPGGAGGRAAAGVLRPRGGPRGRP